MPDFPDTGFKRLNAEELNFVVNNYGNPQAHLPGVAYLDLGACLEDPSNLAVFRRGACMLFLRDGKRPGYFEAHFIHSAFDRRRAEHEFREIVDYLFTMRRAAGICGLTPVSNRAARLMAVRLGAEAVGNTTDLIGRECIAFELTKDRFYGLSSNRQTQ